jgi:predicted nucleic acid-binding Zn finger protein
MSVVASLAYTYRYPFASGFVPQGSGAGLRLATSGGAEPSPYFFRGRLEYPREIADQLLTLAQVVTSRFYLPGAMRQIDPVVTSNDQVVRFEGFSSCCGVYARADLSASGFDVELHGRGTTNVDFNASMRAALARVRDHDRVTLSVGADEVALASGTDNVLEKKVQLPTRWLKGFTEVQAYQAGLTMKLEVPAVEARQFVRSLPRGGGAKTPSWVTAIGRGLRLSQRESKDGVRVIGTERLRLLEHLILGCQSLRIWADADSGTSAWEAVFRSGRFLLMISPEVFRGFSGEGQILSQLATGNWEAALPRVRAELAWQARVDVGAIVSRNGLSRPQVEAALAALGARGLVGYDVTEGAYFHRELPFDIEAVESLQPRLKDARKVVAEGRFRVTQKQGEGENVTAIVMVQGTDVEHMVRLLPDGDKCTCPWFSKHQGRRGACKHVLAARIAVHGESADD